MGGRTGMDYAAIRPALELMGVDPATWPALFEDLRTMERAALRAMAKKD